MRTIKISISFFVVTILLAACDAGEHTAMQAKIDSLSNDLDEVKSVQASEEANKKMVADFYQQFFGDKDLSAIDDHVVPAYIQHNPTLPDGRAALKEGAAKWFEGAAKQKIDIQHLGADGDLVYIHLRSVRGDKVFSVLDIFRIENGKIAEHWDVIQQVPEKSANDHPMF